MSYSVKEILYTLQGEGVNSGQPALVQVVVHVTCNCGAICRGGLNS